MIRTSLVWRYVQNGTRAVGGGCLSVLQMDRLPRERRVQGREYIWCIRIFVFDAEEKGNGGDDWTDRLKCISSALEQRGRIS